MPNPLNNNKISSALCALFLALGIIIFGLLLSNAIKYVRNFDRFVEVKGLSERIVEADSASWRINYSVSGENLKEIYTTINNQRQAVVKYLAFYKFDQKEITNQTVSVIDNYANAYISSNNTHLPRYTATTGVTVVTTHIDSLRRAIEKTSGLIESGIILNANNVVYNYSKLNSIKTSMLDEALANAKLSAEQFAKNSNSQLGKIKTASQGLFTITAPATNLNDMNSFNKKIRVVTTVQFFLK